MKLIKNKDKNFIELLKGSSISLFLKVVGMIFGYLAMLFITNFYGAEEWGIYSLCFTLLSIVILVPKFGFDNAIVRIISELNVTNNKDEISRVLKKAFTISVSLSLLAILLINIFHKEIVYDLLNEPKMEPYIKLISYIVLPTVILVIIAATFQSLKKTMLFMLFQTALINAFFLLLLIINYFIGIKAKIFEIYLYATLLALFIGIIFFVKTIRKRENITTAISNVYTYRKIVNISVPMMLSSSFALLMGWSDILMLSYYKTTFDVGIYNSSLRLAALSGIALIAVNAIASPKFVEFYTKKDMSGLKDTVQKSTKMIFLISVPMLIILTIFSKQILSFFGEEFIVGYLALIYLCASRFINAISGSVGYIMQMTDQQRIYQNVIILAFFINLGLNFLLIPTYGFNGAAIASSIAMVFWNITLVIIIKRKLGFWTIYNPFIKS
jgi:O-antigen/teichoic acid export membrane protein